MAAEPSNKRKDRLAAALKENLKRRKAQSRAKATRAQTDGSPEGIGLGTAPQAGLEDQPEVGLKNVRNRT